MTKTRKFLCVVLALAMVLTLSSCLTSSQSDTQDNNEASENSSVTKDKITQGEENRPSDTLPDASTPSGDELEDTSNSGGGWNLTIL